MDSPKVVSIAEKTHSAMSWSPADVLNAALTDLAPGGAWEGRTKLVVLCLDESDGRYNVSNIISGLSSPEIVSILELAKAAVVRDMGY